MSNEHRKFNFSLSVSEDGKTWQVLINAQDDREVSQEEAVTTLAEMLFELAEDLEPSDGTLLQ